MLAKHTPQAPAVWTSSDGTMDVLGTSPDDLHRVDAWSRFLATEEVRMGGSFAASMQTNTENSDANAPENVSREFRAALVSFGREVFAALYDRHQEPLPEALQGAHAAKLTGWWEAVQEVPGWEEHRAACEGDSFRAGMLAARVLDRVNEELEEPGMKKWDDAAAAAIVLGALQSQAADIAIDLAATRGEIDANEEAVGKRPGDRPGTPVTTGTSREVMESMRTNRDFARIMRLVGRMRPIVARMRSKVRVDWMRDEVTGIEIGSDISRMLSSEVLALADPDLELNLLRRIVEGDIFQRRMRGLDDAGRGPVVFCLDESGSMRGTPDEWAKAVAVTMAEVAMKEGRKYGLVHFDSCVTRVDLVERPVSMEKLLEMVGWFSGGGTYFEPPLARAIQIIREERAFKHADIVLLTDGEGDCSSDTVRALAEIDARLHVVLIGGGSVSGHLRQAAASVASIPSFDPEAIATMEIAFQAV